MTADRIHTLDSDDYGPPDYDAVADAIDRGAMSGANAWPARTREDDDQ